MKLKKREPFLEYTTDQLNAIYDSGKEVTVNFIKILIDKINHLEARVQELEEQISKDSHNSSKPPSSDGFSKPAAKPKKTKRRKPGGQKGHEGKTLRMVDRADHVIVHGVKSCDKCGRSLRRKEAIGYDKRQVFDIPPIKLEVTEHRAEIKECDRCGEMNTAVFPQEVSHKSQYGARLKANAVYIKNYGLLPYSRAAEFFEDLFSVPLSPGTLVNIDRNICERLEEVTDRIKENIIGSPVAHFDETGMRIGGKLNWLHVASTNGLTFYMPHTRRGGEAMDAMGILANYGGRAIHDGWKSYFNYGCEHGLCNAHHIRELIFIYEQYGQSWAQDMIDLLLEIKAKREKTKSKRFSSATINRYESRYKQIINVGMEANPPPAEDDNRKRRHGRKKKTDAQNLLERLRLHERETLAFMYDFAVPFDNNQGERDIRMMKVQQKISGSFRSFDGALSFCRIRSYISTVKKQGMNVISAIQDAFAAKQLLPQMG